MKRRIEDRIAMLAFGELTEREAAEVRLLVSKDPEAAKMLAAYEGMKAGLHGLRDTPEDQLSKERLQDAILAQGLKPSRQPSWLTWAWAPMTTLVVAFVLTLQLRQTSLISGSDTVALGEVPLVLDPRAASTPLEIRDDGEVSAAAEDTMARMAARGGEPMVDARSNERLDAAASGFARVKDFAPAEPAPTMSGPIVLIENELDAATGAQKAIETETYAHVVVAS